MSEVIIASAGSSMGVTPTELHMRRVLVGDIEDVRERLAPALESLGYTVISDDPLQAHRAARGGAASYISNNILDYQLKLTIALKAANAGVTRATFLYSVMHPYLTKGDHQTIAREVDTIVALAAVRAREATCTACGADATGDSRFCRVCGAPLAGTAPAELEVMRLTAGARSAHQTIVTALIVFLCALPMLLISIFGTKENALVTGFILFGVIALIAIVTFLFGIRRLHRTLNTDTAQAPPLVLPSNADAIPVNLHAQTRTPELASHTQTPFSITEGTTELLYVERVPTTDKHLGERQRTDAP